MIVKYRVKGEGLQTVLFADHFEMYAKKDEIIIKYRKEGKEREILLNTSDVMYLEVKPD